MLEMFERFERFRELSTRQKAKQCWKIDKRTTRKIDHASEETFQGVLAVIMYQSITEDIYIYIYIYSALHPLVTATVKRQAWVAGLSVLVEFWVAV